MPEIENTEKQRTLVQNIETSGLKTFFIV